MKTLHRRDARATSEDGFTLMEMVVAISVLAVVLLAVAGVFNSGLRALAAAKSRARANEIATQGIEDLQRYSFNNLGLCNGPPGTPPAGLEVNVDLDCSGTGITYSHPCGGAGTVPATTYTCTDNNVAYEVKRYVSWVDALHTTKRLAVFVEWTDLAGNHQVSQQSSLRAPDQSAITGLAPPKFTATPSFLPAQEFIDADGRLTGAITFSAQTSDLHRPATTPLISHIAAHQPNDTLDITVDDGTLFPPYNGFSVGIGSETFRVIGGAGTDNWTVVAEESGAHVPNTAVKFVGDQVYAEFQTIADNGSPQTSTVFLTPTTAGNPVTSWSAQINSMSPTVAEPFKFGVGKQYVAFGIVRASDGKQTAAFASSLLELCDTGGCLASAPNRPTITAVTAPPSVQIGSSGELVNDITVEVSTQNVTSSDSVTLSFLTQAGSITVALQLKPGTVCPDSSVTTPGFDCHWQGRIETISGYRFSSGQQHFYFAAQQVLDTQNPGSVDHGETAARSTGPVTFAS